MATEAVWKEETQDLADICQQRWGGGTFILKFRNINFKSRHILLCSNICSPQEPTSGQNIPTKVTCRLAFHRQALHCPRHWAEMARRKKWWETIEGGSGWSFPN